MNLLLNRAQYAQDLYTYMVSTEAVTPYLTCL